MGAGTQSFKGTARRDAESDLPWLKKSRTEMSGDHDRSAFSDRSHNVMETTYRRANTVKQMEADVGAKVRSGIHALARRYKRSSDPDGSSQ